MSVDAFPEMSPGDHFVTMVPEITSIMEAVNFFIWGRF